jgi:hypothetical protein
MEPRLDGNESIFFTRQQEEIDPKIYEVVFAPLLARSLIPTQEGIAPTAPVYTYRMYEDVGEAKVVSDWSDDLPAVQAKGTESPQIIHTLADSYGWSILEIQEAARTNTPLDTMLARAAKRAIDSKIDKFLSVGDSAYGVTGLLSIASGTTTFTPATKQGGGIAWADATGEEIAADLIGIVNALVEATQAAGAVFTKYVVAVPVAQYNMAAARRISIASDTTALQFAKQNSPYIEDVVSWFRTKTAGAGGVTRMVAYPRDPMVVAGIVPMEFTILPPQEKNLKIIRPCIGRCGGIIARYPVAIGYGDGI